MEKRVFLAVFLSFLVLYAYQAFFVKPAPKQAPPESTATGPVREPATTPPPAAPEPAPTTVTSTGEPLTVQLGEEVEREVTVDTDLVTAVFTNRGAVLKSWKLKRFLDGDRQPLELVPTGLPAERARPFSLGLGNPQLTRRLDTALFKMTGGASIVDARTRTASIVFEYQDAGGLQARKSFGLGPGSYVVSLTATVADGDRQINPRVRWGPALGDGASASTSSYYTQQPEGILFRDGSVERLGTSDLAKQSVYSGNFRFAGVDDHYFLSAAVSPSDMTVEYTPVPLPVVDSGTPQHLISYDTTFASPPIDRRYFMGPKEFEVLSAVDQELVRAINFGWFAPIVVPLLRALKWINGYVGNYGWSIIILTVLINAAMFPLRHKSVVSMRKMQELQPEVKAIQDRYAKFKATDPERQKMNQEMMNLYRTRGVNPASGCIPMLLTMPVLFAFYSLLSVAIEIRGASFVGWITDLSVHDPLYVTPILMGITMAIQQKMTPTTADPVQQRMMMLMPLVFTFMFLWAPSGLVIYWLVSNLWAIGQQHVTNRLIGPPVVRTVRPPAERRVKKVGGSKP